MGKPRAPGKPCRRSQSRCSNASQCCKGLACQGPEGLKRCVGELRLSLRRDFRVWVVRRKTPRGVWVVHTTGPICLQDNLACTAAPQPKGPALQHSLALVTFSNAGRLTVSMSSHPPCALSVPPTCGQLGTSCTADTQCCSANPFCVRQQCSSE